MKTLSNYILMATHPVRYYRAEKMRKKIFGYLTQIQKQLQLESIAETLVRDALNDANDKQSAKAKNNGQRMRRLTSIIAKHYHDKPEELRRWFNSDMHYSAGIASSAYFMITGDIKPIQSLLFGGLGATINDCESGLTFDRSQLMYAKIGKPALNDAYLKDFSLIFASIEEGALSSVHDHLDADMKKYFRFTIPKEEKNDTDTGKTS